MTIGDWCKPRTAGVVSGVAWRAAGVGITTRVYRRQETKQPSLNCPFRHVLG
jgi:hypothetical protein